MKLRRIISAVTSGILGISVLAGCPVTASAALSKDASEFMKAMGAGWNLGNSLDANDISGLDSETCWGNPKTTKAMIKAVYDAGFRSVRVPVSWANHMDGNYRIDSAWMARVKQVVDYAYDEGMYVILNTHHDNLHSWQNGIGYYPDNAHKTASLKYISSVWTQIADEFKDYGDRLIFETLNEPRLRDTGNEWWFEPANPDSSAKEAMSVINAMNEQAVKTIRSRAGKNTTRYIMVPAYAASHFNALGNYFKIPADTVKSNVNRIVVSVHAYRPVELCLEQGRTDFGNDGKQELDALFADLNSKFLSNGIPVIIGEMGITDQNNDSARKAWFGYYFKLSKKYNIPCFVWDNNAGRNGKTGEKHGHLDRDTLQWRDPANIKAIMDVMKPSAPQKIKYGDADKNGIISGSDVSIIMKYMTGWTVDIDLDAADVDRSGMVDGADVSLIQKYMTGWDIPIMKQQ